MLTKANSRKPIAVVVSKNAAFIIATIMVAAAGILIFVLIAQSMGRDGAELLIWGAFGLLMSFVGSGKIWDVYHPKKK